MVPRKRPAVGRDRLVAGEDVLEGRDARAVRVGALGDLRELVRVAQEDERSRGAAERDDVGEGHLARLVDEEDVDAAGHRLRARRATGCRPPPGSGPRRGPIRSSSFDARSTSAFVEPSPSSHFWAMDTRTFASAAATQTSSTRLVMALWAVAQMPTRFPCLHELDDHARAHVGLAGARAGPGPRGSRRGGRGPAGARRPPPSRRAAPAAAPGAVLRSRGGRPRSRSRAAR